jgi:hypothetical protein
MAGQLLVTAGASFALGKKQVRETSAEASHGYGPMQSRSLVPVTSGGRRRKAQLISHSRADAFSPFRPRGNCRNEDGAACNLRE